MPPPNLRKRKFLEVQNGCAEFEEDGIAGYLQGSICIVGREVGYCENEMKSGRWKASDNEAMEAYEV